MVQKNKEETKIQNEIMLELSKYGIPIRQQSGVFYTEYGSRISIGINGMSDILFLRDDGKPFWLEVKTKKGKPSNEQEKFIEEHQDRVIWDYVFECQKVSEEFKEKYKDKIKE